MKMSLSRESILSLHTREFSEVDKRLLLERLYPPSPLPDWKRKLSKGWKDSTRWAAYSGATPLGGGGVPYRYSDEDLCDRATYFPPEKRGIV